MAVNSVSRVLRCLDSLPPNLVIQSGMSHFSHTKELVLMPSVSYPLAWGGFSGKEIGWGYNREKL